MQVFWFKIAGQYIHSLALCSNKNFLKQQKDIFFKFHDNAEKVKVSISRQEEVGYLVDKESKLRNLNQA